MADLDITQAEADALIAMEKHRADDKDCLFPPPGGRLAIALTSLDKRENFMLDITRPQIKLTKATYRNRARQAIVLMRLDLDGPPHRNPIGKSPAHIFISIEQVTATSGPFLPRLTDTLMCTTCFPHSRRSCGNAISRTCLELRRGFFHDRRRDRKTSERLPGMAQG